jgi:hypothetical protein
VLTTVRMLTMGLLEGLSLSSECFVECERGYGLIGKSNLVSRLKETLESARLSGRFESHPPIPGCHTFLILHRIAETFGLDAELA